MTQLNLPLRRIHKISLRDKADALRRFYLEKEDLLSVLTDIYAGMAVTLRSSRDRMRRLFSGESPSTTHYEMATRHCWRIVER